MLGYFSASLTSATGEELQELLELSDPDARMERVLLLLKKEAEVSKLQESISKEVRNAWLYRGLIMPFLCFSCLIRLALYVG